MQHTINRRNFVKLSGSVLGGIAAGSTVVAAERTDRFIVDIRGTSTEKLEQAGLDVIHDLTEIDVAVVEGAKKDLRAVTKDFAPDTETRLDLPIKSVTVADGDAKGFLPAGESATDEPFYPLQWDKQVQNIPAAHEVTRGEGTRVAIIDTGVAAGHPDLNNVNQNLSRDFTDDGFGAPGPWGGFHGTHVAGIVGADDTNEQGVVGTAPMVEIVDCRVFSFGALASFADVLAALVYAASVGCDAANMSLGAYPIPRRGLGEFYGRILNRTTTFTNSQGTVLVVSAGNDAADLQHDGDVISLPNEAAQALSISATGPIGFMWDADGDGDELEFESPPESPAFYTNYGTNAIDFGAPGGDAKVDAIGSGAPWFFDLVFNAITEPDPNDLGEPSKVTHTYGWVAGTSMSAPQVTGAVALVRSRHPEATPDRVESILKRAASVPNGYDKSFYGAGFLDPLAAINDQNNDGGNN